MNGDDAPVDLSALVERVPIGWTLVVYAGRAYGLTRVDRAAGRSVSIYAEQLGGSDVVSANVYRTTAGDRLNACEMPDENVRAFLAGWRAPVTDRSPASRRRRRPSAGR